MSSVRYVGVHMRGFRVFLLFFFFICAFPAAWSQISIGVRYAPALSLHRYTFPSRDFSRSTVFFPVGQADIFCGWFFRPGWELYVRAGYSSQLLGFRYTEEENIEASIGMNEVPRTIITTHHLSIPLNYLLAGVGLRASFSNSPQSPARIFFELEPTFQSLIDKDVISPADARGIFIQEIAPFDILLRLGTGVFLSYAGWPTLIIGLGLSYGFVNVSEKSYDVFREVPGALSNEDKILFLEGSDQSSELEVYLGRIELTLGVRWDWGDKAGSR